MPDTIAPVLTPTEARQASPRRLNLHVLIWSMLLAVVAAAVLYYGVYAKPESSIGLPKEQPAFIGAATLYDGSHRARGHLAGHSSADKSITQSLQVTRS